VGSNELAMAALADAFDPRYLVISVRSPLQLAPFSFGWFHVTFTANGPVIDGAEAETAWTTLASFIDEAAAGLGADPRRVFLAGFSQGGIVALATMLTSPERVAGAVCMSGRLPPEVEASIVDPDRLRGKPVLIVHGRQDATIGVEYGRRASDTLRRLPLSLTYREFDIGHAVGDEMLAAVSAWLTDRLDEPISAS
jgi:phospholipase/carboxylesterase